MHENLVARKYLLMLGARKFSCAKIATFTVFSASNVAPVNLTSFIYFVTMLFVTSQTSNDSHRVVRKLVISTQGDF